MPTPLPRQRHRATMGPMETLVARSIAVRIHTGQSDRFGQPVVGHLARVAAAVSPDAQATAWLHDAIERTTITAEELRAAGLTLPELEALVLLSRTPSECYELYVLRIAFAHGEAGRLARIVKLADLDNHIARGPAPAQAPPYRWARRRIAAADARRAPGE